MSIVFDYSLLKGEILKHEMFNEEACLTQEDLESLLNNERPWKLCEIVRAAEALGIDDSDVDEYFFKAV